MEEVKRYEDMLLHRMWMVLKTNRYDQVTNNI